MISRYENQVVAGMWSEKAQLSRWYTVERTWLRALFGIDIPELTEDGLDALGRLCRDEEKLLNHDVAAFVKVLEAITGVSRVHFGLTSSDVVDTALMLGMKRSIDHLVEMLWVLRTQVSESFENCRKSGVTVIPGRTHGVIAEPIEAKALYQRWSYELDHVSGRLREVKFYGKFSGSVGLHQGLPEVAGRVMQAEHDALGTLGLQKCLFPTQVIPRELFLDTFVALLGVSSTLTRLATQLRLFASHGELRRVSGPGERGSSSMPHKTNPIGFEKVCGMHRMVEAAMLTASQNCLLWAERDISHSSVERVIIPDTLHLVAHQVSTMIKELSLWEFDKSAIDSLSLDRYRTQAVMLRGVLAGESREAAFVAAASTAA